MSSVAIFDPNTFDVYQYIASGISDPDYKGRIDADLNPDVKRVVGNDIRFWRRIGVAIYDLKSAQEIQAIKDADAALAAQLAANMNDVILRAQDVMNDPLTTPSVKNFMEAFTRFHKIISTGGS